MQVIKTSKKGPSGCALVVPTKSALTVNLYAQDEYGKPDKKKVVQTIHFGLSDLKSGGTLLPKKLVKGEFFVRISYDLTKLYSLHPWNATVEGVFSRFWAEDGKPPMPMPPYEKVGRTREGIPYEKDWTCFRPIFTIISPDEYAGLEATTRGERNHLRFHFAPTDEGFAAIIKPKSDYTARLINFLDRTYGDAASLTLKWSDVLLLSLQDKLREANRRVTLIIENGSITGTGYAEAIQPRAKRKK